MNNVGGQTIKKFDRQKMWAFGIFLFALLSGLIMQMRGPLLINFKQAFSVTESLLGLVAPAGTLGFLSFLIFSGMRSGKFDVKKYLLIGAGLSSVFALLVGISPTYFLLLGFIVGRGAAGGIFRGTDRPILSHLYSEKRGWIFNLHELAWAIGATLGPIFVNLILSFGSWRLAYYSLAILFIPVFLIVLNLETPSIGKSEEILSISKLRNMLSNPAVFGMVTIIILNAGIEGGFFTWLPYYVAQSLAPSTANLALSGYLAAYIPGRYFYSQISKSDNYLSVVLLNTLLISILLFLAFFIFSTYIMLGLVFLVGFLVSGNFPTLLAMGTDTFPEYSGPMNALAMGSSALGMAIFPAIMGVITEFHSAATAMRLLITLPISIFLICLLFKNKIQKQITHL